ncbi:hypothetical protein [Georgenia wangjunii]|uniref:hypothetical protein n=1 Tax=Georgenia wangjunii TaxID=3117730 RepID=UPI002F267D2A
MSLFSALALAGCSDSTGSGSEATATATATAAAASDSPEAATCAGFFEGTGTPLAERAEAARAALSGGEVTDDVSYGEINMLEQRLSDLAADAPAELAEPLEAVNAPFTEAVSTVNDARAQEVPEGEEAAGFPDLSIIDVSASETAQTDVESACADAGFEVAAG